MKEITDKIKDWDEIHKLLDRVRLARGEEQREYGIKVKNLMQMYARKYDEKYNLLQKPK